MAAIDTVFTLVELGRSGHVDASVFEWMLEGLEVTGPKGGGVYTKGMLATGGGVRSLGAILTAKVPSKPVAKAKAPAAPKRKPGLTSPAPKAPVARPKATGFNKPTG